MERRCSQPEEGQRLLSESQSTCGNNTAQLSSHTRVLAAAFGQDGWRDCHLLEADESLVGAETQCQCRDPSAADGVALETETNREDVRMGQSLHWGVMFEVKSAHLPISLRNRHLSATGADGSQH